MGDIISTGGCFTGWSIPKPGNTDIYANRTYAGIFVNDDLIYNPPYTGDTIHGSPALNNYHTRDLLNVTTHSEVIGGAQYEEGYLSRRVGAFGTNDVNETSPYYNAGSPHMTYDTISSIF